MLWAGAIAVWPIGVLIDRYGARPVVTLGAAAIAPILFMLPFVEHFWQYCVLFSLLGVCRSVVLGYSKIVAALFDRRRGLALGVFAAESAAMTMLLPVVSNRLVADNGWRGAFQMLGILVFVVTPLIWFGLAKGEPARERAQPREPEGEKASGAMKTRAFWLIVAAALVTEAVSNIVLNSFQTALPHRGFGDVSIIRGAPIILLATLAGPICAGFWIDRTRSPAVATLAFVASALAGLLSAFVTPAFGGMPLLMTSFALGAFAFSAQSPMIGYLFSRYFGLRSFATICSLQALIQAVVMGVTAPALAGLAGPVANEPLLMVLGTAAPLLAALFYLLLPAYRRGAPLLGGRATEPSGGPGLAFRTWWSRAPS
jgi:MFS family permease